jgi:hypothetical protein
LIKNLKFKNMKNLNKIMGLVICAFFLLASCENNFDTINSDTNAPEIATPALLCTNVIISITKYGGDAKSFISNSASPKYVGYTNEGQMGSQYNSPGSGSFYGMNLLPNIASMNLAAKASVAEPVQNSYEGVGKFAKAWNLFRITMAMGDIPYTEAGLGATGLTKPKYDLQEDVFKTILEDLKAADQFFANGAAFAGDPTPYNGDPAKWRRATNSFALKVLMSLSKKEGLASLDVKTRFSQIVANGFILNSSTGFFGLIYSTKNPYPIYSVSNFFTSRTIMSSVLTDPLKLLNDRRLFYYAEPSVAQKNAGKIESDPAAYIGANVSDSYTTLSAEWSAKKYSIINLRYQKDAATEPRMLLTFAEQQLVLAEAHIKGWISMGTAQGYYEEGVKAALTSVMAVSSTYSHTMPITAAYISGYFTGEAAFKATTDDQLKQIWLQRYILNYFQDGDYSYWEYRRNGYPVFPINPATNLNATNVNIIPLRNSYPSSEAIYNDVNLKEAVDRQFSGFDDVNKAMWLLQ